MTGPKTAVTAVGNSKILRALARAGYVVLGIVHIVIGLVAITIATGGAGSADQSGAMSQIRQTPVGVLLLWLIAVGLLALAIWQIIDAVAERDPDAKKKWGYRVKFLGTAVAYLAIAWTAVVYAVGGQSSSAQSSESFSAQLLRTPGGVFLLVLVGIVIGGIGLAFLVRGARRSFAKHLDLPGGAVENGVIAFGVVGYLAKGIAITVTGILFVVAAVTHNPAEGGGLDDGLHALAGLPFGTVILWVVGAGLVVYGIFCFARARYARM